MTNEDPNSSAQTPETASLRDQLTPLLADLFYPSESDEPVGFVTCYLKQADPLTVSQVKEWLMLPPAVYVEERPEAGFWEPVVTEQDWYSEEEKARTGRFQQLKQLLVVQLTLRQVFYAGETEIDVYLLGRTPAGDRAGLKTRIVQT